MADAVKKWEDLNIGQLAVSTAVGIAKRRPVSVSLWALGLLLAGLAGGFAVDEIASESFKMTLAQAEQVDRQELGKAMRNLDKAETAYRNAKGWFWSCDAKCQRAWDKVGMAKADVERVERKRDSIMTEARKEVGIWSTFGVKDVRSSFWSAWQSGKDFAARWTMMDAIFLMMPGGREESLVSMLVKLLFQYIVNLTMGLIGAFFFFIHEVYRLIVSYGEDPLSGIAFFLLVLIAAMSMVGTYLCAVYGTVVGGGLYLIKQAAKQAAVEGGRAPGQRPPRQVQYNQYTYGRPHMD